MELGIQPHGHALEMCRSAKHTRRYPQTRPTHDCVRACGRTTDLTDKVRLCPLSRLMRVLVHSGFSEERRLEPSDQTRYVLNCASELLVKDSSFSSAPTVLTMLDPSLTKPCNFLKAWYLNNDRTTFETAYGMKVWEYAGQDPKFNQLFNDAMASDSQLPVTLVTNECASVFEGINSLVDVGGGTGLMAKAIADAFSLECTVFDLPHVVADLPGSHDLKSVGGDRFEGIPPADAIMLKLVLHDWNDEDFIQILKQCKSAISSTEAKAGKVIIVETVMENHKNAKDEKFLELELALDMTMMMAYAARESTENEWAKLFSDAGFGGYKMHPVLGFRSLIEVYP
ncbi:hypothetical protein BT93_A1636 [Corymbia citriodora subsp. variegata]|nr:hypothetical protein BT93_A1636 [Corymbia citriodora subsp. variegata]